MPNDMNGMDNMDNMNGGTPPQPPADTTSPTTSISASNNNDGTITWTITFDEAVENLNADQFTTSDMVTIPALSTTSGTSITITTTHTTSGEKTLSFDSDGGAGMDAADDANNAATDAMAMASIVESNFLGDVNLANVPSSATSLISTHRQENNDNRATRTAATTLTIGTDTYNFASATSNTGALISTGNDVAIINSRGTNVGFTIFYEGENIGTATSSFSNVSVLQNTSNPTMVIPTSTVSYTGEYIIANCPASNGDCTATNAPMGADFNSHIFRGTFDIDVDFTKTSQAFTGTATDAAGATSGTFSGGNPEGGSGGVALTFQGLSLRGQGSLSRFTGRDLFAIGGDFAGTGASEIVGTGNTSRSVGDFRRTIIGLRGSSN